MRDVHLNMDKKGFHAGGEILVANDQTCPRRLDM